MAGGAARRGAGGWAGRSGGGGFLAETAGFGQHLTAGLPSRLRVNSVCSSSVKKPKYCCR